MITFRPLDGRADPRALPFPAPREIFDFNPARLASILRGRIYARPALLKQAQGEDETLKHEQAIADYERQIDELQGAGQ